MCTHWVRNPLPQVAFVSIKCALCLLNQKTKNRILICWRSLQPAPTYLEMTIPPPLAFSPHVGDGVASVMLEQIV